MNHDNLKPGTVCHEVYTSLLDKTEYVYIILERINAKYYCVFFLEHPHLKYQFSHVWSIDKDDESSKIEFIHYESS